MAIGVTDAVAGTELARRSLALVSCASAVRQATALGLADARDNVSGSLPEQAIQRVGALLSDAAAI